MADVVVTRLIAAAPPTVFSFFTDADRWTSWQGVDAEIDARAGGTIRIRMPGAQVASGNFVEVVPNSKLVFTWGWEGEAPPVLPGSTTVVIELESHEGGTLLRLTQRSRAATDRRASPAWLGALPRSTRGASRRRRPRPRLSRDVGGSDHAERRVSSGSRRERSLPRSRLQEHRVGRDRSRLPPMQARSRRRGHDPGD